MWESLSFSLLSPQRGPSCFEDVPGCPYSCPYHLRRPQAWGPRSTSAPLISPQVAGMLSQRASAQSVRQWRLRVGTLGAQLLLGTEAKHRGSGQVHLPPLGTLPKTCGQLPAQPAASRAGLSQVGWLRGS